MYILRWLWEGFGYDVSPSVVYWTLRVLMLTLSVVMEDWAIHELVASPRARRVAVMLVASSYVTWTFQTHTFSNSLETLLVLWSLVVIQRITDDKVSCFGPLANLTYAANARCRSALASWPPPSSASWSSWASLIALPFQHSCFFLRRPCYLTSGASKSYSSSPPRL
jgi:hypothetical protein